MRCITFSGIDGSGKSTQLNLLKEKLERDHLRVAYFHAIEFSLANKFLRLLRSNRAFVPGQDRAITKASWLSLVIRQKFLFIDMLRFRRLLRKLERQRFDYLLSDRSFYDSFVNLEYLACNDKPRFIFWKYRMRLLDSLMPRPDRAFLLDIDPETVISRERAPEQGVSYLASKRKLFLDHVTDWNFIVIDAGRDTTAVSRDIISRL